MKYLIATGKRLWGPLALLLVFTAFGTAPGEDTTSRTDAESENKLIVKNIDLDNCSLRLSPSFEKHSAVLQTRLSGGLKRLNAVFEKPALKTRPVFWLLEDKKELKLVLEHGELALKPEVVEAALASGLYRDDKHIVLVVKSDTPVDWVLRVLFTEYARSLMDALAPSAKALRIGWFYAGLSTYMAWMVVGEQDNQSQTLYEKYIFQYYGRYFNPDKFLPLELLESPADWNANLERDPSGVYAQAVLAYLYLARKKGPLTGVVVLRVFDSEDAFSAAFERASGMGLKAFEEELKSEMYAEVRKMRAGQAK